MAAAMAVGAAVALSALVEPELGAKRWQEQPGPWRA